MSASSFIGKQAGFRCSNVYRHLLEQYKFTFITDGFSFDSPTDGKGVTFKFPC